MESYIANWPILVEEFLVRLKPISIALDRIQRDNPIISDTVEVWKMLQADLKNTGQPINVLTKVHNKATQAITPAHNCANLIDPRYRGKLMSTAEIDLAMSYMNDRHPKLLKLW